MKCNLIRNFNFQRGTYRWTFCNWHFSHGRLCHRLLVSTLSNRCVVCVIQRAIDTDLRLADLRSCCLTSRCDDDIAGLQEGIKESYAGTVSEEKLCETYTWVLHVLVDLLNCLVEWRFRLAQLEHLLFVFVVRVDVAIFDPGATEENKLTENAIRKWNAAELTGCEIQRSRRTLTSQSFEPSSSCRWAQRSKTKS